MTETTERANVGPPDTRLWEQIAKGDHAAFTELFERHAEAVWNYAYRLTASWSQAEDLLSATFLTAWRKRGDAQLVRDSALPWLYTVTANRARTEWRASRRALRLVAKLTPQDERDHADEVAARTDAQRRLAQVVTAIAKLPASEREIAQLCLLGDVSTADAAALLGIAESSVRARVSRTRARLRDLTPEDNG
ncbi:RNA polymerase sigma factor [Lentzea flaviverrucosa]|uniref:RNA polymerase sigma-70 factor, ECF subfamily n=1 Tax=Lentzea flaviverrucosa TaxID=200379 RepID=A0A1H9AYY9_9PSEU|nr:sigma-70 family RNA polymerase sigma factor [Lentzea flaviverrucosa]RDI31933.1 RNA polymerase sigma-70 factor (ECF subfamily) [Lentzea flaviverrucosa]SEP81691.1 RNA polymerase sigma-70 factor, ECF subfamily [Lentzea flaviverrucosa]